MFAMKAKRFCQCGKELERSQTKDGRAARWPKYCSPECQAEAYKINQPTAVYTLADALGEPLYVGVSSNLKQRMIGHKATKDWWESVANIDFEEFTNRLEAEIREAELIKTLRPLHNRAIPIDPTSTPDATDGMNRVLVVFSDGLLSELDSARGLVSRSAWIRQAVEDKLMKEAVAPLVPDYLVCNCGHPETLHRKNGTFAPCQVALCECQLFSKIRTFASRPPLTDDEWKAFQEGAGFETPEETEILTKAPVTPNEFEAHKAKPKARRKKLADPPGTHRDKGDLNAERRMAIKSGLIPPDRCNRGACTGTINPVSGRCLHCMQTPLKESK